MTLVACAGPVTQQATTEPEIIAPGEFALALGGPGFDSGNKLATDKRGNVFVAGAFDATARFGDTEFTSKGQGDGFVTKLDPQGKVLWTQTIGGVENESIHGLAVTADGSVAVAGELGDADGAAVHLYSGEGELRWSAPLKHGAHSSSRALTIDSDGSIYALAEMLENESIRQLYLSKLTAEGALEWSQKVTVSTGDTRAGGLVVDGGGAIYLTAWFEGAVTFSAAGPLNPAGLVVQSGALLARYSRSGQVEWLRPIAKPVIGLGAALALTPSGEIFVGHNLYDECRARSLCPEHPTAAYLARYDASGNRLSEQTFTHPSGLVRIHAAAVDGDELLIAGMLTATELLKLEPTGTGQVHAARLALDGTPRKLYRSQGNLIANDVATASEGLVRITGYTEGAVSFGGAPSDAFGDWDAFVVSVF